MQNSSACRELIRQAFVAWETVIAIDFAEISNSKEADIAFEFVDTSERKPEDLPGTRVKQAECHAEISRYNRRYDHTSHEEQDHR